MTLPGVSERFADAPAASGPNLALATPFVVGETELGPQTVQSLTSITKFSAVFGARTTDAQAAYDWLDDYFREGGGRVYFSRRLGASAAVATGNVVNGSATVALVITAKYKGDYGNRIKRQIVAGAVSGYAIVVLFDRQDGAGYVEVERSPDLATGADAVAWATSTSTWVNASIGGGGGVPAVAAAAALTSGNSDISGIGDTQTQAALDVFTADLGPGHVVLPSVTTTPGQLLAAAHAAANNRLATVDGTVTTTVSTLTAQATTLRAGGHGDVIDLLAPRVTIPGLTAGGTRSVGASALRCAAQAVNDRAGISPNQPAAGIKGQASYATDVSAVWTDAQRETLNDAGVNVVRVIDGAVRVYGNRTLANLATDPAAIRLGSARLRMAISEIARFEGEQVAFEEVDEAAMGALEQNIRAAIGVYIGSLYELIVSVELVDGSSPGLYVLQTGITFQAKPDAERVEFVISRTLKEN